MSRLIEWLIFRLPAQWYDEAYDTSWISWGGKHLCLTSTYHPMGCVSISILNYRLRKVWHTE